MLTSNGVLLSGGKNGIFVSNSSSKTSSSLKTFQNFANLKITGKQFTKKDENKTLSYIATKPTNIYAIAEQNDGKVLIGGNFGYINDIAKNSIARLNADGSLDESFGNALSGANGEIYDIKMQRDGKILISGYFSNINGFDINAVARLNSDGSIDDTFNITEEKINGSVNSVEISGDTIFVAGNFNTNKGNHGLLKLDNRGVVDKNFSINFCGEEANAIFSFQNLQNEKYIIAGDISCIDDTNVSSIVRINSDGSLDKSFSSNEISGYIFDTYITQSGDILIGGDFEINSDDSKSSYAMLNSDGTIKANFSSLVNGDIYDFEEVAQGVLLVSGEFSELDSEKAKNISLINLQ